MNLDFVVVSDMEMTPDELPFYFQKGGKKSNFYCTKSLMYI